MSPAPNILEQMAASSPYPGQAHLGESMAQEKETEERRQEANAKTIQEGIEGAEGIAEHEQESREVTKEVEQEDAERASEQQTEQAETAAEQAEAQAEQAEE